MPLSEGRINSQGHLECPYHGWSFAGDGACQRIPQGGNHASPRACATPYAVEERQGLIFVWGQPCSKGVSLPDPSLIRTVPELEDPTWVPQDTWRDLPMDWSTLLENVLDSSHVPFTHHKSMSNRNNLNVYDIELTEPVSQQGFSGIWHSGPRAGSLGPQTTEFRPPGFMKHKLQSKALDSLVVVYAVPTSPGKCRLINRNVVRLKGGMSIVGKIFRALPGWVNHVGAHTLLEDDQIFLHHGEVELAGRKARGQRFGQACFTPSLADTYVIGFQRWLEQFGGGGPFGPVNAEYITRLEPRLSREQLLDRFSQHTANCAQCQKGLGQLKDLSKVLVGVKRALQAAAVLCGAAAAVGVEWGLSGVAHKRGTAVAAMSATGSVLMQALHLVVGNAGSAEQLLVRGAAFAVAAFLVHSLIGKVSEMQQRFLTGVYPPPRNVAKD